MHVVVVGGGLVGSTLAERLAGDGHDVVMIERNRELIRVLNEQLDIQTIVGNGATVPALRQAGIDGCDLLLATTDSDEANMVVALVGSALFDVPRVVARLRDPDHEESFRALASERERERLAINPESAAVDRILSLIPVPGAFDVVPLFGGALLVAGFLIRPRSELSGLLLNHLKLLFPATPMLAVAIRRNEQWRIPHGDDELQVGDLVYFAMDRDELSNVLVLLGIRESDEQRLMIAGATRIGVELAQRAEATGRPVTLIDADREACEAATSRLERTLVIHGSPISRDLLEEEGAEHVASFVACADDHEENVVSCLLARRLGVGHTFGLVDNPALASLIGEVGIDAVISPRMLSVGLALQFARKGEVRSVAPLLDDAVEVIEAEATGTCRLVSAPIADLGLPRGVIIAAIKRGDEMLVPKGPDQIRAGDIVVAITSSRKATRLDEFLDG